MDNQNQQQSPNPQYHQTVVIVGKQKSVGVAFILAFFFGPLGLLYASVTGGIVMFILGAIISIVTLGFGLILVWIICIIWAVVAANNANSKIPPAASVNINMGATPSQQPLYQAPKPPVSQPLPQSPIEQLPAQQTIDQPPIEQPIVSQFPKNFDAQPQYAQPKQQGDKVEKMDDLSLNTFSDWVTNNKKGLMFGIGGIVIILVLIVAIKYVVSVDFSKHKQNNVVYADGTKTDSAKMDSAKMVDAGGDSNTPTQFVPDAGSTNSNNSSANYPGVYPQSSTQLLTPNDLASLDKRSLKIMRNEIFARHGYIFKTADMKSYFARQNWYRPLYSDVTNQLTSIEKTNVELIKNYER